MRKKINKRKVIEGSVAIAEVFKKYKLSGKQSMAVHQIVSTVHKGNSILVASGLKPGKDTIYKASVEILKILGLDTNKVISDKDNDTR